MTTSAAARFGRLLVGYRTRGGLTQEEAAERAELSVRGLRNLERGLVATPRRRTVDALVAALRLGPDDADHLRHQARVARAESSRRPPDAPEPLPDTDLVGRHRHLRTVREHLTVRPMRAAVVDGAAGTGKTALVTHVGRLLRPHFPDGHVLLTLDHRHGTAGVAARLLHLLGVDRLPPHPGEQLGLYRRTVAGRRLLVVADDASAAQARLLLTHRAPPTGLLVTSRSRLPSLTGVPRVTVSTVGVDDGVALLGSLAGHDRVAREKDQAYRIVRHCDGLPLALRIAGARLAGHPGRPLAWLAARLAAAPRRLDELAVDDLSVRAALRNHLDELPAEAGRLLPVLGRFGPAPFTPADVAAASGRPVADVETPLDELATRHVVRPAVDARGAFTLPPLTALFVRERHGH